MMFVAPKQKRIPASLRVFRDFVLAGDAGLCGCSTYVNLDLSKSIQAVNRGFLNWYREMY